MQRVGLATVPVSLETLAVCLEIVAVSFETLAVSFETLAVSFEMVTVSFEMVAVCLEKVTVSLETVRVSLEKVAVSRETLATSTLLHGLDRAIAAECKDIASKRPIKRAPTLHIAGIAPIVRVVATNPPRAIEIVGHFQPTDDQAAQAMVGEKGNLPLPIVAEPPPLWPLLSGHFSCKVKPGELIS